MYKEHRDARDRLHRTNGPAIEADDRQEWWIDGRRHRDDGPAIVTANGTYYYYWRGTLVPHQVILDPKSKSPEDILTEANVEVRRAWMEAYGLDEFMKDLPYKTIDENKEKELLLVQLEVKGDESLTMVRVKNSTPEPDGHYKMYWLRVPPTMKDAEEAVAWTFDMDKKSYKPAVET